MVRGINWGLELTAPDTAAPLSFMRLRSFGARSALEISDALPKLRKEGAEEFVIDLRGNGGTARLYEITLDHVGSHWLECERPLLVDLGSLVAIFYHLFSSLRQVGMDPEGLRSLAFQVAPSQLLWRRQSCSCPKVPSLHRCGGLGLPMSCC